MNHIAFAKGKKNTVLVQQDGYEDKEYTLAELKLLYNSLLECEPDGKRLPVIAAALSMLLKYGVEAESV